LQSIVFSLVGLFGPIVPAPTTKRTTTTTTVSTRLSTTRTSTQYTTITTSIVPVEEIVENGCYIENPCQNGVSLSLKKKINLRYDE
jgi:hypothetical protein